MVILWFVGDVLKLGFFVTTDQPIQFILCAIVQNCVDLIILFQFFWYKGSEDKYTKLEETGLTLNP